MAEGLLKQAVAGRKNEFEIGSAGIAAYDGYPSTLETIRVMHEAGADVSDHRSRRLTRELVDRADKIFVMEKMHREMIVNFWPEASDKVHLLTEFSPEDARRRDADVPDPIRTSDEFYREILRIIDECVRRIAATL